MINKKRYKKINKEGIPVVIFCGGKGTRLQEETQVIPKPLVKIGEKPILWHIMKIYSTYGFNNFILPVGYKGEKIKEYFYNYSFLQSDFTVCLNDHDRAVFYNPPKENWKVTVVDTGIETQTGARLRKIEKFIPNDLFMLTYGDGVADIDINKLLKFHLSHAKIGTVTGIHPLPRLGFGKLAVKKDKVVRYKEKPKQKNSFINGGFFVFNRKIFKYLSPRGNSPFEKESLERLSLDGQLMVYKHKGFWQCMDTLRDVEFLNQLWKSKKPPWKIWS